MSLLCIVILCVFALTGGNTAGRCVCVGVWVAGWVDLCVRVYVTTYTKVLELTSLAHLESA